MGYFSKENLRKRAQERLHRQDYRETGGAPRSASFHRSSYHRNFEGWTEKKEILPNGKMGIRRIYTGKYYEPALTPNRQAGLRLFYVLLAAGGILLFGYTATRTTFCNNTFYVGLSQAATIAMLLWLVYNLIFYVASPGKMTIGDYNTIHKPLCRSALAAAVCLWAAAALSVLSFILHRASGAVTDLLCAAGFSVCGAVIFVIYFIEHRLTYNVVANETTVTEGSEIE